jgi:hypothetical protein
MRAELEITVTTSLNQHTTSARPEAVGFPDALGEV